MKTTDIVLTKKQFQILEPLFEKMERYIISTGKKGIILGQAFNYVDGTGGEIEFAFFTAEEAIERAEKLLAMAREQLDMDAPGDDSMSVTFAGGVDYGDAPETPQVDTDGAMRF